MSVVVLDWRLRWGLLEIYRLGEERYVGDYATEYAKIINSVATMPSAVAELARRAEVLVASETPSEQRTEFIKKFKLELVPSLHGQFSEAFALGAVSAPDQHSKAPNPSPKPEAPRLGEKKEEDDGLFLPGVFGRRSAMTEAEKVFDSASTQLSLGNGSAAREELVRMFRVLQEGGWNIWGGLSERATRAEEMLCSMVPNAADLVGAYGSLVKNERYAPPWRMAEHLIFMIGDLLGEQDGKLLLDRVIEHIGLMVGDAALECASFGFLNDPQSTGDPALEVFSLILWMLDNPKWIRRERAAVVVAWLAAAEPSYLRRLAQDAFAMKEGHSADVLCGVLDDLSRKNPLDIWNQLSSFIDPTATLQTCRHVSRVAMLHRVAERASTMSISALDMTNRISSAFRPGAITLDSGAAELPLPAWARCIEPEWRKLESLGAVSGEVWQSLQDKLKVTCTPLSIDDGFALENAVSRSFREPAYRRLNRWEARVRFALNLALIPYASACNFTQIEKVLRIFDPTLPEHMLVPGFPSHSKAICGWLEGRCGPDEVVGTEEICFLSYQEMAQCNTREEREGPLYIEVVAVIVPSSLKKRALFAPELGSCFKSTEIPRVDGVLAPHETCARFDPQVLFFGGFTPAIPLPHFVASIDAAEGDFLRLTWRHNRSGEVRFLGRPTHEGCLLGVKRRAVNLPVGRKMAWLIRIDGKTVAMLDAQNNRLY